MRWSPHQPYATQQALWRISANSSTVLEIKPWNCSQILELSGRGALDEQSLKLPLNGFKKQSISTPSRAVLIKFTWDELWPLSNLSHTGKWLWISLAPKSVGSKKRSCSILARSDKQRPYAAKGGVQRKGRYPAWNHTKGHHQKEEQSTNLENKWNRSL